MAYLLWVVCRQLTMLQWDLNLCWTFFSVLPNHPSCSAGWVNLYFGKRKLFTSILKLCVLLVWTFSKLMFGQLSWKVEVGDCFMTKKTCRSSQYFIQTVLTHGPLGDLNDIPWDLNLLICLSTDFICEDSQCHFLIRWWHSKWQMRPNKLSFHKYHKTFSRDVDDKNI